MDQTSIKHRPSRSVSGSLKVGGQVVVWPLPAAPFILPNGEEAIGPPCPPPVTPLLWGLRGGDFWPKTTDSISLIHSGALKTKNWQQLSFHLSWLIRKTSNAMIPMESTFLYSSSLAALTHSTEYAKKSPSKEKRGRDKSFQADIHLSKVFMTHWHSCRTVLLTT